MSEKKGNMSPSIKYVVVLQLTYHINQQLHPSNKTDILQQNLQQHVSVFSKQLPGCTVIQIGENLKRIVNN